MTRGSLARARAVKASRVFPPVDHWIQVECLHELKYQMSPRSAFTRDGMDGVPTDDDIIFTELGLLILEDYAPDFTIEDVGRAWLDYLPYTETAEKVALRNLKDGVPAAQAAAVDNPFDQWIGADIRSDPWGYVAPGLPEKAAELASLDAHISHLRNGRLACAPNRLEQVLLRPGLRYACRMSSRPDRACMPKER